MNLADIKVENIKSKFQEVSKGWNIATLEWFSIILLHCAFIPTYLSVMTGLTDRLPSLDIAFIVWSALLLYFIRSVILKDTLNIITIGVGFIFQVFFLGFIFFR